MKKILVTSLALLISFTCLATSTTYAKGLDEEKLLECEVNELGVSTLFSNFIDNAFYNLNELCITDNKGVDVTKNFIDKVSTYYSLKDYKSIQKLIESKNLLLSYEVVTEIKNPDGISPAAFTSESVKEYFYHLETDESDTFTKEWLTSLSGYYTYDISSHRIVSASSPTLKLDGYSFGAAFSPSMDNVRTSYSISGESVRFSGRYTMTATLGVPIGDFPIGFEFDFGSFDDYFSVSPF